MDPIYAHNEGKLVATFDPLIAEDLLARMREHRHGLRAAIFGTVIERHVGMIASKTAIGGTRIIPLQIG
ncbi:hypothetical protein [Granulicella sp. WH15]|uniref:hypothetical protein n=1 Tax=Granulicella sp. WH15 TaxID=2602070 RepID=UPI001C702931|nr:hypothetical protein [Granulicella sp. WH15]